MTNKDLDRLLELPRLIEDLETSTRQSREEYERPDTVGEQRIIELKAEYKSLKAKLEGELEKAEKLDECLRNPNEVMQWSGNTISRYHLQISKNELLELENKQLKEENVRLSFTRQCSSKLREDNDNLKQKLEKIEELVKTPIPATDEISKKLYNNTITPDELRKEHSKESEK